MVSDGIHFNISHSGHCAVCAISIEEEIGIDVEQVSVVEPGEFTEFFTGDEIIRIKQASEPMRTFYDLWTKKEAILKAEGNGLLTNPKLIELSSNDLGSLGLKTWKLEKIELDRNYICHVALPAHRSDHEIYWNPVRIV